MKRNQAQIWFYISASVTMNMGIQLVKNLQTAAIWCLPSHTMKILRSDWAKPQVTVSQLKSLQYLRSQVLLSSIVLMPFRNVGVQRKTSDSATNIKGENIWLKIMLRESNNF